MISHVYSLVNEHPLLAAYIASAFVTALPEPGFKEPAKLMIYRYFYTVFHSLVNAIPSKFKAPAAPVQETK